MNEQWLPTLITPTPQEGYDLAVKLSRAAVKMTQPDADVRIQLRKIYEKDATALVWVSSVVSTHFQTVATANNFWRKGDESS